LGLAIVKKIITAHGGNIEVQSEPNVGSVFSFSIPLIPTGEVDKVLPHFSQRGINFYRFLNNQSGMHPFLL